ncbi:hypothetical protein [Mesorhizobium sp. M0586]|uniref:hypothetical protein n=1 Tax=unclassified Mesorhizobium TaxID=325217 RepID=UPI00333DAEB1
MIQYPSLGSLFGILISFLLVASARSEDLFVDSCKQDDCTREWVTEIGAMGDGLFDVSVTSADYKAPGQGKQLVYTSVTQEKDRVHCGSTNPYTRLGNDTPVPLGDFSDLPSQFDIVFVIREALWKAVCEGKYGQAIGW